MVDMDKLYHGICNLYHSNCFNLIVIIDAKILKIHCPKIKLSCQLFCDTWPAIKAHIYLEDIYLKLYSKVLADKTKDILQCIYYFIYLTAHSFLAVPELALS